METPSDVPSVHESAEFAQDQPNPSAAACALHTLRSEIFGFSFNDLYEVDCSAALPNSLHYPVYSDKLTWETMRMDSAGIPRAWSRTTGINYWPAFIAWYGLVQLCEYQRSKASRHLDAFLKQLDWLEQNAVLREDGAVVWQMNFDHPDDGIILRSPWVSAHAQGLVISAVVRGWRITKRPQLWKLLEGSAKIFDIDVSRGGVRVQIEGNTFYTELPGGRVPGILDGFLVSLIGLHDLYVETHNANVNRMFMVAIEGLRNLSPLVELSE